jgi:predicted RNase H-like nuclease
MTFIGLDGFSKGWVAVTIDGDRRHIDFISDISWLATQRFDRAAIDIPIGLSDDGVRACDQQARKKLSPHGSRVFSGARRWLWQEFTDPDLANTAAEQREQTKVSRQLWHIGPKIMEVDRFVRKYVMRAYRSLDIREVHPELVFLRLNNNEPLASKHTGDGLTLRRRLLIDAGFTELDDWLTAKRMRTGAKRDDVLDACAVAIAARDLAGCVPEGMPPRDDHGLPMQIWF